MFRQFFQSLSKKLFKTAVHGTSRRKPVTRKLEIEALESRQLMAGGLSASLSQGILTIEATPLADKIVLRQSQNKISIAGLPQKFEARQVKRIVVEDFESNDKIKLMGGGAGRQTIKAPAIRHWSHGLLQRRTPIGGWKYAGFVPSVVAVAVNPHASNPANPAPAPIDPSVIVPPVIVPPVIVPPVIVPPKLNSPPVLSAVPDQTVIIGKSITVQLAATDADGDAISYAARLLDIVQANELATLDSSYHADPRKLWDDVPPAISIALSGKELTVTAADGALAGEYTVEVAASDGVTESSTTFSVRVGLPDGPGILPSPSTDIVQPAIDPHPIQSPGPEPAPPGSNEIVYALQPDGWLSVNGQPTWAGVQSFAVGGDYVYVLKAHGELYKYSHDRSKDHPGIFVHAVVKYLVTAEGACFALTNQGEVRFEGSVSWTNKIDMALDSQGRLLLQGSNGDLHRSKLKYGSGGWDLMGSGVVKFLLTPEGACFALTNQGEVRFEGSVSWTNKIDMALDSQGRLLLQGSNGDLHRSKLKDGSGGWDLMGSAIRKSILTPQGDCYALGGNLVSVNGQAAWSNTRDFALDANGTVYWISIEGVFQRKSSGGSWQTLDNDVVRYTIADGVVYSLGNDGWLNVDGQPSWANTREFDLRADGTLYWVGNDGVFQRRAPAGDWQTLDNDMVRYVIAEGAVYSLGRDGWLNVDGQPSWANTRDFALAGDGTLHWIGTSGVFQRRIGEAWQTLDNDVQRYVVAANGLVYSLGEDGWLNVDGHPSWANTRDFALAGDGTLYWIGTSGVFQRRSGGAWQTLDNDVVKHVVDAGGVVYSLGQDGWLNVNGHPSWANTRDFALAGDGTLYWIGTSGVFERKSPGGSWQTLDNDVVKYVVREGVVYSLGRDGWLNVDGHPSWAGTRDFALYSDGTLCWISTGGVLERRTPGGAWQTLDNDVVKYVVAADGAAYSLGHDGWLNVNGQPSWAHTRDFTLDANGGIFWIGASGVIEHRGRDGVWKTLDAPDAEIESFYSVNLWPDGTLRILGSHGGDILQLRQSNGYLSLAGARITLPDGSRVSHVDQNAVKRIEIDGGSGNDFILFSPGFYLGHAEIVVNGGVGNDTIHGSDGADMVLGGFGDDVILGHGGNDNLAGGLGSDRLDGADGDDILIEYGGKQDGYDDWDALVYSGNDVNHIAGGDNDDVLITGDNEQHDLESGLFDFLEEVAEGALALAKVFSVQFLGVWGPVIHGNQYDDLLVQYAKSVGPVFVSLATGGALAGEMAPIFVSAISSAAGQATSMLLNGGHFRWESLLISTSVGLLANGLFTDNSFDLSVYKADLAELGIDPGFNVQYASDLWAKYNSVGVTIALSPAVFYGSAVLIGTGIAGWMHWDSGSSYRFVSGGFAGLGLTIVVANPWLGLILVPGGAIIGWGASP